MESIRLLGVRIDKVDMNGAVEAAVQFVESGKPHYVVTADASSVVIAQKDPEFREIVNRADLVTPDSAGILLASKWYGSPITDKVSGCDFAVEICAAAAKRGYRIFLLGAAHGVAEDAAAVLVSKFPGLVIAGVHDGFFNDDERVVRLIRESGSHILFVAMGIPKQEKWISRYLDQLGVCVAVGVGGTFDVISGRVKRAPEWMRRHGLEWAYRLLCNPRKIGKVMTLPKFLWLVFIDRFVSRKRELV